MPLSSQSPAGVQLDVAPASFLTSIIINLWIHVSEQWREGSATENALGNA